MKKFLYAFAGLALGFAAVEAQPQGFNYQALVRDNTGAAVRNRPVGLRMRLHQDSANAAIAYAETFAPTTNNHGNVNLVIGRGSVVSGTFSSLDWSRPVYLEIGVDLSGGTTYADLGTTQLLSVPYALYAGRSGTSAGDLDNDPVNEIQTLSLNNNAISLSRNGGQVVLPPQAPVSQIQDADGNTRVSTERSPNENIIRFDLNGVEKMRLRGNALEFPNGSISIGDSAGALSTNPNSIFNVFIGRYSGRFTTGNDNTFSGDGAGASNTIGSANSFYGARAGSSNTTGVSNVFDGVSSGELNSTGSRNTFTGTAAGYNNTSGGDNTFVGNSAGASNTAGSLNTFVGFVAGGTTTGSKNTYLGAAGTRFSINGADSLNVFIGYNVRLSGSNKLAIDNSNTSFPLIWGDFATDSVRINGGLSVARSVTATAFNSSSDRRLKEDVAPLPNALEGVGRLNGVYYRYKSKAPDGNAYPRGRQIGVIAQDVEKVYPELVTQDGNGFKAVDYPKLTAVLIEAVKELSARVESLEKGRLSAAAP